MEWFPAEAQGQLFEILGELGWFYFQICFRMSY
jgi:hypothetical protein